MGSSDPECSIEEHEKILEMQKDKHTDQEIKEILLKYKRVAVVGMSREEGKDSHEIPKYLINKGYDVTPVNPNADSILNKKSYPSILDVPGEVDIVDIFRPSDKVLQVVDAAISKNPKAIWMQEGISNDKARKLAESKGITVIFNRCMMKEHVRLFGN